MFEAEPIESVLTCYAIHSQSHHFRLTIVSESMKTWSESETRVKEWRLRNKLPHGQCRTPEEEAIFKKTDRVLKEQELNFKTAHLNNVTCLHSYEHSMKRLEDELRRRRIAIPHFLDLSLGKSPEEMLANIAPTMEEDDARTSKTLTEVVQSNRNNPSSVSSIVEKNAKSKSLEFSNAADLFNQQWD